MVTVIVRLSRDESGLGEAVLAGSVSRWSWLLSAVGAALTGAAVLLAGAGFGNGLGAGLTLGEPHTIVRLTLAALASLPAMAVVAAVAALGVALRHPGLVAIAALALLVIRILDEEKTAQSGADRISRLHAEGALPPGAAGLVIRLL